jgi:citrate synthase
MFGGRLDMHSNQQAAILTNNFLTINKLAAHLNQKKNDIIVEEIPAKKEFIYNIIAKTLSIPRSSVSNELAYQTILQWDSLSHITLMLELEKNFHIKIDQNTVLELTSVEAIISYVLNNKNIKNEVAKKEESISRGLNNVYFDESKICYIDAENSILFYRGHSILDLVENYTYEQVVYLLIHAELPETEQLNNFNQKLIALRSLPDNIHQMIYLLSDSQSLNSVIRTVVSALAETVAHLPLHEQGLAYIAKIPTIMGAYYHYNELHKNSVQDTHHLSHVQYVLLMLLGYVPEPDIVRIVERNMILQAEHESNASTFAARVARSTEAELGNALTSAISTFSGVLHGGALNGVLEMLNEISHSNDTKTYIQKRIKNKQPIFGFGHRVYRSKDPRSEPLQKNAEYLSERFKDDRWLKILESIKFEMQDYMTHGININDDFHACISYLLAGLSSEMLLPVFITARSVGWVAHILEQSENNILIRPRLKYTGKINGAGI